MVTASGNAEDLQDLLDFSQSFIQKLAGGVYRRILLDVSGIQYNLTSLDIFKSAEFAAGFSLDGHRLAAVYDPRNKRDAMFWETVAVNRGMSANIFEDHTTARRWLFEETSS